MRRAAAATCVALALAACVAAAARSPQAPPFFLIPLSDPQFGFFTADRDFAQETANFEFAVASVNRLRPAFVVVTGDLVNKPGDRAQTDEYLRIARKIDPSIPLYNVAGNHDVENVPTPASLAAYRERFGPDRYVFRHQGLAGIVLNSSLIHSPGGASEEYAAQTRWLEQELDRVRRSGAGHIVIFQHHPWFLAEAAEPDQYFNIPLERRATFLAMFHKAGVRHLFSGHYHRNALARDGDVEMITTGPVGRPLAGKSGIRVAIVRETTIEHRYYEFGEIPAVISLTPARERPAP